MKKAVLLLSGGLDSAANLVLGTDFRVELALTVDYGQRAAAREEATAKSLAHAFDIEHQAIKFNAFPEMLGAGAGGALLQTSKSMPRYGKGGLSFLENNEHIKESARAVWVPNRNGLLISLAAAVAESRGLEAVALGFNAEEARTFPDNTIQFMQAMTRALSFSTATRVQVVSATAQLLKHEIVRKLEAKGFPFELIWSCYEGAASTFGHCSQCESCTRFIRAISLGVAEPKRSVLLARLFGTSSNDSPYSNARP